jgi:pimeloyl-ACP methyl ester carboxylesterase
MAVRSEEPEEVISSDGTRIAAWRSGEGPPLVLVHGTAADHTRWASVLPWLEERFTVWAVDRRGRGQSGDADGYGIEREYEDVAAVVESARDRAAVLGHSYGGICALESARLTDRVGKLILYEPPLGFLESPPDVVRHLQVLLEADERDELVGYFMREVAGLPADQVELLRSLPAWEARLAVAHTIPREERASSQYAFDPDRFRELEVPTLFLLGGDSPRAFRAAGEAAQKALPNCRVAVMPGHGHAAMDTGTDLFLTEVSRFLETT